MSLYDNESISVSLTLSSDSYYPYLLIILKKADFCQKKYTSLSFAFACIREFRIIHQSDFIVSELFHNGGFFSPYSPI